MSDKESAPGGAAHTLGLVSALVAGAGLRPAPAELLELAAAYPAIRRAADRLSMIAADADPAPTFDPLPLFRSGPAGEVAGER